MRIILPSLSDGSLENFPGRLRNGPIVFDPAPILSLNLAQVTPFVKIRIAFHVSQGFHRAIFRSR
jgi:hypothetical protein